MYSHFKVYFTLYHCKFQSFSKLFRNYLPLEKDEALYLNIHEFSLPIDALCQVWMKLAQWFWRRI